jgi:hypothetical protein
MKCTDCSCATVSRWLRATSEPGQHEAESLNSAGCSRVKPRFSQPTAGHCFQRQLDQTRINSTAYRGGRRRGTTIDGVSPAPVHDDQSRPPEPTALDGLGSRQSPPAMRNSMAMLTQHDDAEQGR